MFLFLHGAMETNSSLIPLIKSIFDLGHDEFSDRFLLDNFTIQIPGFDDSDKDFDFGEIEDRIIDFHQHKLEEQKKLVQDLIFCKNQTAVSALKEDKLNIIGNEIGAGISLEFATKNPELVSSITLINCAIQFSGINNHFRNFHIKNLLKKKIFQLQSLISKSSNLEDKKLASILLENPEKKGFFSYLELMKNYNFNNLFNRLSINEQIEFTKIPILCLIIKNGGLVGEGQAVQFGKILNPNNNFVKNKHSFIRFDEDNKTHFYYNVVENGKSGVFEIQNLNKITNLIKEFLQN
jgi:hypothetical protein